MAQFRKAVVTEKGLALILKTQIQSIKLEFSKIVTGSGEYAEDETLNDVAALKQPMQEFGISSVDMVDPKTVKLTTALTNEGLEKAYFMREIGLYAVDPDEGDILYSLSVAYPGKADYLPEYQGGMPVNIYLDTYQSVSDSENVIIRAEAGTYALAQDFNDLKHRVDTMQEAIKDIGSTSARQLDITIPISGWVEDEDTGGTCALHTDIAAENITEEMIPMVTILPEGQQTAIACNLCTTARTIDGALRVYAQQIPSADIRCSLTLFCTGGAAGGGTGTGYILPVASASQLGGVKVGKLLSVESDGTLSVDTQALVEEVGATEEESTEMLDDVFGKAGDAGTADGTEDA